MVPVVIPFCALQCEEAEEAEEAGELMTHQENRNDVRCVVVVQCHIAHERCSGAQCATAFANREHRFADYGPETRYYIPFTCGGCSGRRTSRLLRNVRRVMKREGVEPEQIVVHLSACVVNENSHYPPCPHLDYLKRIITRQGFRIVEGTYVSETARKRREAGGYDN